MYRVNYQFDKHTATILMISVKDGDSWKQLNDSTIENKIEERVKKISKNYEVDKLAYGEMHLTENLTFITNTLDIK